MAEKENDTGTTTVRISRAQNAKLGKLCKQFGLSRQEFLESSVMYFSRPGKDPRQGSDDAMLERLGSLEQTLKRFQSDWHASKNTWEKNYLKPGSQADVQLYMMLEKLTNSATGTGINGNSELVGMILLMFSLTEGGIGNDQEVVNLFSRILGALRATKPGTVDLNRVVEMGREYVKFLKESKQKEI